MFDDPRATPSIFKNLVDVHNSTIDELYKSQLPDNFYLNHYELSNIYEKFSPEEWRKYLKTNDRFIINEVSAITEASARQALSRLGSGELKAGDAAAIKQLLDRSEQINASSQDKRTFVVMQFDPTHQAPPLTWQEEMARTMTQNSKNFRTFYNLFDDNSMRQFDIREQNGEFIRNIDGTLHFPTPSKTSDMDRTYLRLFNPNNEHITTLPKPPEQEGDWQ